MPEVPEIQAHAERLTEQFAGRRLERFVPLTFTALKTASPLPDEAYGEPLISVDRRGKYLLLTFAPITFVVHLMQGGRLLPDDKLSPKPRGGQARFVFAAPDGEANGVAPPALLLTEQGTERRAGVWCVPTADRLTTPPLDSLGPEAAGLGAEALQQRLADTPSTRLHGWLRNQHSVAGIGRRLANEICHRAKVSPFATTRKLTAAQIRDVADAIDAIIAEGLAAERQRSTMSSSKERPSHVHGRTDEPCNVCGDTIRAVEYSSYTINYCPTCQTGGKVLADNTTSKFLR